MEHVERGGLSTGYGSCFDGHRRAAQLLDEYQDVVLAVPDSEAGERQPQVAAVARELAGVYDGLAREFAAMARMWE